MLAIIRSIALAAIQNKAVEKLSTGFKAVGKKAIGENIEDEVKKANSKIELIRKVGAYEIKRIVKGAFILLFCGLIFIGLAKINQHLGHPISQQLIQQVFNLVAEGGFQC